MNFEEYALSYCKKYFTDDKEIHAIVNFAYNTTTKIQAFSDTLYITVYEYVKGEEHDAKKLFGGMLYSEYQIYVDTNANTTSLSIENWATIQATSITDNILSLSTQYDTLWNTITVDFGKAGKVINSKSDMDATERCFLNFVLE